MNFITTSAGTYAYYPCLDKDNKKGTIIFIHGFATTSEYHDGFIEAIKNEYDYYALQLPGHGIADYPSSWGKIEVDFYTDYCVNLIKSLDLGQFFLIGHSMGGGLGIRVANKMQGDVIAFVAVTPMNSHLPAKSIFNYWRFTPATESKMVKLSYRLYNNFDKTIGQPGAAEFIKNEATYQMEHRPFFVQLKKAMFSLKNVKLCRLNEQKLQVPTLGIAGQHDKIIPFKSVIKALPNEVVIFSESGHLPFQEEPDKYNQVVLDFFAKYQLQPEAQVRVAPEIDPLQEAQTDEFVQD